jgi:Ca2+-binding RTX toxin-like protein
MSARPARERPRPLLPTPYWVVCSQIHSTRWILGDGDDQLLTSKFMPGPYYRASAPSVMHAGAGDDHISGWFGHDVLAGGPGNDDIIGGDGQDVFSGGAGDDGMGVPFQLEPATGSPGETFHGGPGNDGVRGGNGNDVIIGGAADDYLSGGFGDDRFVGGTGADTIRGGGGTRDVADYASRAVDISVSDDGVANDGEAGEGDNVLPADPNRPASGTEIVEAGSGNDILSMSGAFARLHGNVGDDSIALNGGPGALFGGPGTDVLTISGAPGRLRGGAGDDQLMSSDTSPDRDGCGPGTDDLTADANDVVNANCENVTVGP